MKGKMILILASIVVAIVLISGAVSFVSEKKKESERMTQLQAIQSSYQAVRMGRPELAVENSINIKTMENESSRFFFYWLPLIAKILVGLLILVAGFVGIRHLIEKYRKYKAVSE